MSKLFIFAGLALISLFASCSNTDTDGWRSCSDLSSGDFTLRFAYPIGDTVWSIENARYISALPAEVEDDVKREAHWVVTMQSEDQADPNYLPLSERTITSPSYMEQHPISVAGIDGVLSSHFYEDANAAFLKTVHFNKQGTSVLVISRRAGFDLFDKFLSSIEIVDVEKL